MTQGKTRDHELFSDGDINHPFSPGLFAGIWCGKLLLMITRILGRGGTTLPGRVALTIAPHLLTSLTGNLAEGSLVITGTNGKTTTAALITGMLKEKGHRCIHNQSGSNLTWGVASTLIGATSWTGRLRADCAVLEVDEGAFPRVCEHIRPRGIIITNIFRDQLDRYGEVDRVKESIQAGISSQPAGGFLAINADDPSLAGIAFPTEVKRWTYGIETDLPGSSYLNTGRDIKSCPRCLKTLDYAKIYFAHLGHYRCLSCGYRRPEPDVVITAVKNAPGEETRLEIGLPGGEKESFTFSLPGNYNLYNLLAALTCAQALGITHATVKKALKKAAPAFGRMESFFASEKEIVIALIKNPVGANEVLHTVLSDKRKITLLASINDNIADGKDISWLWDVDFEQLAQVEEELSCLLTTGRRAWDMAVRFKYAGLSPEKITVVEDSASALEKALEETAPGEKLYILPTYTAMLEMRRHLNKMGLGKPFWEDA